MLFEPLYGKNSDGSLKIWTVSTEGSVITVTHGKLGGKMQTKDTVAKGKNIGKANETSDEQQADIEALAKHVKQLKRGYFLSQEEALAFEEFTPMKCQDYKDFAHKVQHPVYMQPKLNGLRCMIDKNGQAWSKAGEPYELPEHIQADVNKLSEAGLIPYGLDGEIYAGLEVNGGLSLQKITAAFRKKNSDTPKLSLWLYDVPVAGMILKNRLIAVESLHNSCYTAGIKSIVGLWNNLVTSEEQGDDVHSLNVSMGFEGSVYKNINGLYDFGARSYDVLKRKDRADAEAKVVGIEKDKNDQGVLLCELQNGVQFKCLMLKDSDPDVNYRLYENAVDLIDGFIKFEFEEFSDDGVPTKPVGVSLRNVDPKTWVVKE